MDTTGLTRSDTSTTHRQLAGECNRCGADSRDGEPIFRAVKLDVNGDYHPHLCGKCIQETSNELLELSEDDRQAHLTSEKYQYLQALLKVMPEEYEDAIVAEMARIS